MIDLTETLATPQASFVRCHVVFLEVIVAAAERVPIAFDGDSHRKRRAALAVENRVLEA
jgi:hypothetical protein